MGALRGGHGRAPTGGDGSGAGDPRRCLRRRAGAQRRRARPPAADAPAARRPRGGMPSVAALPTAAPGLWRSSRSSCPPGLRVTVGRHCASSRPAEQALSTQRAFGLSRCRRGVVSGRLGDGRRSLCAAPVRWRRESSLVCRSSAPPEPLPALRAAFSGSSARPRRSDRRPKPKAEATSCTRLRAAAINTADCRRCPPSPMILISTRSSSDL